MPIPVIMQSLPQSYVRVFHTVWSDGSKNKKAFDLEYVDAGHFAFIELPF